VTYQRDPTGISRLFALNHYLSTVPKRFVSGNYTAELDERQLPHVIMWVVRDEHGNLIGGIWSNDYYEGGRFSFSVNHLVSNGKPYPEGYPKNGDAALCFDGGPFRTHQWCLDRLAKQGRQAARVARGTGGGAVVTYSAVETLYPASDILKIAHALGLTTPKNEKPGELISRIVSAAHQLRRDHDTMADAMQRAVRAEYQRRENRRKR
jgi:hypothetical protein